MKCDLNVKNSKSARRTLAAFSGALFELLEKQSLESVTISILCEACDYPRATFYNYFSDIYDLLDYCMSLIQIDLDIEKYKEVPEGGRTKFLFGIFYDYMTDPESWFSKAMVNNPPDGCFVREVRAYIKKQIGLIMNELNAADKFPVDSTIMIEHYGSTIELILSHSLMAPEPISREQAMYMVDFLLCTLERKVQK